MLKKKKNMDKSQLSHDVLGKGNNYNLISTCMELSRGFVLRVKIEFVSL